MEELSATKKGWNKQHPTTINNRSKKWTIVSSYLQLSWLDSIIAWLWATLCYVLLRSEIPSGICAKLRTVAASNNRVHMPWSLYYCLFAPHICMVLFFTHIPLAVNHTIKATPPERLQQYHTIFLQETWLAKQTLDKLTDISDIHFACGTAEVDYTKGITSGRPYGWTAILSNKKLNAKIFMNQDQSIISLGVCLDSSSLNFINVYVLIILLWLQLWWVHKLS